MGLTVFLTRVLPALLLAACLAVTAVIPSEAPPWIAVAAASGAVLLAFFLIGDSLLTKWLRTQKGRDVTPKTFLLSQLPGLLFAASALLGLMLLYLWQRLTLAEWLEGLLLMLSAGCAVVAGLSVVAEYLRRSGPESKNPLAKVRSRLAVPPLKKQIQDAWDFQKICGTRVFGPLLVLWGSIALVIAVTGAICGTIIMWSLPDTRVEIIDYDAWPLLVKISAFAFIAIFGWSLAVGAESTFRIVNRVRRAGRIKSSTAWKEVGISVETLGFLPSIGWGSAMMAALALEILAGLLLHNYLKRAFELDPIFTLPPALLLTLVLIWFTLVLPQMYIMAVLMRRDCGWMRAFSVSLEFVNLEGREAIAKALVATAMALTIVGIPGAVFLLIVGVEKQDLLISAILNEKTTREIENALTEEEAFIPAALRKHYEQLDRGRYLDALNGFQLYLRNHHEDVDAMRGQGLALLYIGNRKAREVIERWESLDPEAPEPKRILQEITDGLWFEKGRLYEEVQKRCTQPLGRGV